MGPSRMLLSKPVIAAVEGFAVAGGLELACWCDLRVADDTAIFGVFCRRWGVPLIDGGTVRLPRLIGMSRANDMILTGRPVDAKEAYHIGLANRLVARGTVTLIYLHFYQSNRVELANDLPRRVICYRRVQKRRSWRTKSRSSHKQPCVLIGMHYKSMVKHPNDD